METLDTNSSKVKPKLIVLGAGESGVGAAVLGKQQGFEVFVSDSSEIKQGYKEQLKNEGVRYEEKRHTIEEMQTAGLVIKSPGIPETAPVIKYLREKGIRVIGEIEFAAQYTKAKTICITGSNGKSTTTMLTYHILKKAGLNVGLAGNIGKSFALQVATEKFDIYVLEISSFMLDDMYDFRADIAVLLNITPDHLDRYDYKMENYANSKFRITQNQRSEDVFIYCQDDPETLEGLKRIKINASMYPFSLKEKVAQGAYLNEQNEIIIKVPNHENFIMSINDLALQGKHNVYNNMASGIVAKVWELRNETIRESMGDFVNIPHRLEHVSRISGIEFINDSKATNVNSVWYALESLPGKIVLIMGGVDKGNDYNMLKEMVQKKVRGIVCLGKDNRNIHNAFEEDTEVIVNTATMSEAVQIAYHIAQKGDTVLLSPACASFDLFKNYEDRGDQFKAAVREL
ncbi:UDP-N-acetylmuramoyl-L-alanine--D-glutamate ligase [Olivibacter domesticus]|uniref:UDP-N-acetylmuramoylalanine--D-glutamate ligase n=1 Tax=Olivibacter domesticus TaxID=407022 RepID=A0A1H7ZIK4_OLID1|nr:UDP-N-acetylmuramoyl-L-alanine--D-glutamate ligase [Olivibacter domesticus]SEM58103.1 UDP-N-acetylmuramoylalanine--D-glutamate ligase [Olivibacter domesticus]SEM60887.1 UDP-N-acetylmuramoylalanine--D-glutamate ligase [Olivibacter domesticus]